MTRLWFSVALMCALRLSAGTAHAQPLNERRAERLAAQATASLHAVNYEAAARDFLAAFEQNPIPAYLFHAGLALKAAGRPAAALNTLETYLSMIPSGAGAAGLKPTLKTLRARARRTHGLLKVLSNPPGAAVSTVPDGRRLGRTPVAIWLPHGQLRIRVEAAGGRATEHTVELSGSAAATVSIDLEVKPARPGRGRLRVQHLPPNATLHIDAQTVLTGTGTRAWEVAAGSHTVLVMRPARAPWIRTVEVPAGGAVTVDVSSAPRQPASHRGPAALPTLAPRPHAGSPQTGDGDAARAAGWILFGVGAGGIIAGVTLHTLAAADDQAPFAPDDGRVLGAYISEGVGLAALIAGLVLVGTAPDGVRVGATALPGGALSVVSLTF